MIQLKNAKELAVMRRACEISALALRRGGEAIASYAADLRARGLMPPAEPGQAASGACDAAATASPAPDDGSLHA